MGYPPHRAEIQRSAKKKLDTLSLTTHLPMEDIIGLMDTEILQTSLHFPGIRDMILSGGEESVLKERVLSLI